VLSVALQVDSFLDSGLPEDVMTSPRTLVKPQARQKPTEVIEPDRRIGIPTQNLL
jgi:hypothetical protein